LWSNQSGEWVTVGPNITLRAGISLAVLAMLGGCATTAADTGDTASASDPAVKPPPFDTNPYPSTYRAYPGVPTAITNVTVFDGEGGRIDGGTVVFANGKIVAAGDAATPIPAGATVIDGTGRFVTPGIIDVHSHLGVYPSPGIDSTSDGNEATSPTTPEVWAEHSVWPQDPGFGRAMANGGITALQILPGSANLMGGRTVTLKNVPSRTVQGMKFPGAPYGMKMACGENPKRVYGGKGRMPSTRMGNFAVNRATWARALEYKRKVDAGKEVARDLANETLAGVLAGDILVHNHCYRADEMALVIDMAKEFGYKVTAFHHAVESYKVADLLAKNGVCSAMWADWWGFKLEAYDGIPENAALLTEAKARAVIHSDSDRGIQRLNQEAGKAYWSGLNAGVDLSEDDALRWITLNPAWVLGIDDQTGSLAPGKRADLVVWNAHPFSVYASARWVFVDGALRYDADHPEIGSDFEVGQAVVQ